MEANISTHGRFPERVHGLPNRLMGDERLAQEVGAGNERAFTTLFQRYHQQLYRFCRGLTGSDQDAQDALQTTFTKALVALRQDRRNAPLRPWLYRIAHNEAITVIRSRNAVAGELPLELAASQGVSDSAEERERMAMLVADLRELPEQQRGALVMRELSGLSHEEIAAALQLSVGAAKQSILEARRSLLEFGEGRAMTCEEIQRIISDDDRRSLRSRRVRAHMRDCGVCAAFAQAIPRRRADMLALWPMLPAASSVGLLAKLTGAGSGHGGGGVGLAAGTAAKGIGATITIKAAAVTSAAVLATATVGAVAVLHHSTPVASGSPSLQTPVASHTASGSGHGSAATRAVAGAHSSTSKHHANGKGQRTAAGKHAVSQRSHGKGTGSNGSSSSSASNGHGRGLTTTAGHTSNHGHASSRSATASHHAPAHTSHRKPVKVHRSVVHKSVNVGHGELKPQPHRVVTSPARTRATGVGETKTTEVTKTKTSADTRTKTSADTRTKTTTDTRTKTTTSRNATTVASTPPSTTTPVTSSTPVTTTTPASTATPAVTSTTVATTDSTSASSVDSGTGNGGTPPGQTVASSSGKNSK